MASATLLDIAKATGNDKIVGLIEENLNVSPVARIFPMRTIKGTQFKTGFRVSLPTTGFRGANEGQTASKSGLDQKLVECYIMGGLVKVDKAVAMAHEDGMEAYEMMEADGVMQSALLTLGSQAWYGTDADAKGFPGLKAFTPFGGTTTVGGDALTINAAGTTSSTASSVYLVKFGEKHTQLVAGMGGSMELPDFRDELLEDADGNEFDGRVSALTTWVGLQIGSENSVRRICNLTADSGKGLTDLLLADALATFPTGVVPDAIFMSRRSRGQLQKSRTVVLQGSGKNRPDQPTVAPIPTEYDGIPIYTDDTILNTDAIEA